MTFIINYDKQLKEKNISLLDVFIYSMMFAVLTFAIFMFSEHEPSFVESMHVSIYCMAMGNAAYAMTRTLFWLILKIKPSRNVKG